MSVVSLRREYIYDMLFYTYHISLIIGLKFCELRFLIVRRKMQCGLGGGSPQSSCACARFLVYLTEGSGQRLGAEWLYQGSGIPGDRGYRWRSGYYRALISHSAHHGGTRARTSHGNTKRACRNPVKSHGNRKKCHEHDEVIRETVGSYVYEQAKISCGRPQEII